MTDDTLSEFERKRLDAVNDATKWTPVEMLRYILDEIAKGEENYNAMMVIGIVKHSDTRITQQTYRANLTRPEECFNLAIAQDKLMGRTVTRD